MNFTRFIILALLLSSVIITSAQDDPGRVTKKYQLEDFRNIYLKGGFRVHLRQGDVPSLEIHAADSETLDNISVENSGSSLRLKVHRKHFDFSSVHLFITFKTIESLYIEGGVTLNTRGYLDLEDLLVKAEGGSKIDLDLKVNNLQIIGEGGMLLDVTGVAKNLDVKISGAAHVDADELRTENVEFKIEGLGTGSVFATETLRAKVEGVGKIKYRGNPEVIKNIEGLGSVVRE